MQPKLIRYSPCECGLGAGHEQMLIVAAITEDGNIVPLLQDKYRIAGFVGQKGSVRNLHARTFSSQPQSTPMKLFQPGSLIVKGQRM